MNFKQRYNLWSPKDKTFFKWTIGGIIFSFLCTVIFFFLSVYWPIINGKLEIDYKEDSIFTENGKDYAKIEILNNLGYPLKFVNGTATIRCNNFGNNYSSGTFKLEGEKDLLGGNGGQSEFLLSPDSTLINLYKIKNYDCVDALFKFGKYDIENDSYQKLIAVYLYNFFLNDGNLTIIKKEEIPSSQGTQSRLCLSCNVRIDVYASDNKHFIYEELSKFVSGVTYYPPFPLITSSPEGYYPNKILNQIYIHRLTSFDLCKNISKSECKLLMCKKISEKYSDFPCDSFTNQDPYFITNPFSDKMIVQTK